MSTSKNPVGAEIVIAIILGGAAAHWLWMGEFLFGSSNQIPAEAVIVYCAGCVLGTIHAYWSWMSREMHPLLVAVASVGLFLVFGFGLMLARYSWLWHERKLKLSATNRKEA